MQHSAAACELASIRLPNKFHSVIQILRRNTVKVFVSSVNLYSTRLHQNRSSRISTIAAAYWPCSPSKTSLPQEIERMFCKRNDSSSAVSSIPLITKRVRLGNKHNFMTVFMLNWGLLEISKCSILRMSSLLNVPFLSRRRQFDTSSISRSRADLTICLKWAVVKSVEPIRKVVSWLKIFTGTYLYIRPDPVKSSSSTSSSHNDFLKYGKPNTTCHQ